MRRAVIALAAAAVVVLGGGFAWFWFSGGSGEPSTELTTPTIAGQTTTTVGTSTTGEGSTSSTGPAAGASYVIQAESSEASFTLNEVLRGEPTTVVGVTSEIAGQFTLDLGDLSATRFSDVIVNARTFTTGNSTRDRAIRGPIILNSASDDFEFITFAVTAVEGLSGTAAIGDTLEFTVVGDLTIRDVTDEVEFVVTATLLDEATVQGEAIAEVLRSDFGIGIPSVASVAGVTDEVTIRLAFVASAS